MDLGFKPFQLAPASPSSAHLPCAFADATAGFEASVRNRIAELANLQPTVASPAHPLRGSGPMRCCAHAARRCRHPLAQPCLARWPCSAVSCTKSCTITAFLQPQQVVLNSLDDRQNSLANGKALRQRTMPGPLQLALKITQNLTAAVAPGAPEGGLVGNRWQRLHLPELCPALP